MSQYDVADIHDAEEWEEAKKNGFSLVLLDQDTGKQILLLKGKDLDEMIGRIGAHERKMERVLENHIY